MNKVKIITDSTADIRYDEVNKLDISVIPLNVIIEDKNYFDSIDISPDNFYHNLRKYKNIPTTSQPSPNMFVKEFARAKEERISIIYIGVSSGLSGTLQSALVAKNIVEYDNIYIIDSLSSIQGLRLLVLEACKLRDEGLDAPKICDIINELKKRIKILSMIDTLEYLYRGGRLSHAAAILGNFVRIKPLIDLDDKGKIRMYGKTIGRHRAYKSIIESIDNNPIDTNYKVCYGYTSSIKPLEHLIELVNEKYPNLDFDISQIGPTIGTHIGEEGFCIVYIKK